MWICLSSMELTLLSSGQAYLIPNLFSSGVEPPVWTLSHPLQCMPFKMTGPICTCPFIRSEPVTAGCLCGDCQFVLIGPKALAACSIELSKSKGFNTKGNPPLKTPAGLFSCFLAVFFVQAI